MVAIVLLPGMDGAGTLFADFVAALGADFVPTVVSYPADQALGYGALEEFVRASLPLDQPFLLLGDSFSGPVAISLAASRPAGLIGLILCCSFARYPIPASRPIKMLINFLPMKSNLISLIGPFLLGSFSSGGLRKTLRQTLGQVPASTLRARILAIIETDYSEKLKEIQVPILYLQASGDHIVPSSAARHIAMLAPSVQIATFKGPHLLLQVLAAEVAVVVKHFSGQAVQAFNTAVDKDAQ
ncbi:alpha/beta fold hydrolase [Paraherbaspirillum soli]|uniref:Alpha/beta fold hydrolase n=1 Tax=Paraherbaspirillum soli TaxID=631222 RepID=A0ABW0MFE2_9BURK